MPKEIQLSQAKCTGLAMQAPVVFGQKERKEADFIIEAYTGAPVERWWGKLAVAVKGIKAKKNMPIFRGHNYSEIVGFSNDVWKDGSFFVSGKFSETTQPAQEVKGLAAEGFPWQASIGVRPLKILSIEKDAKQQVNGMTVEGPAEIWLESEVFETSFVPFGADDNTSVSMLAKFEEQGQGETLSQEEKEQQMAGEKKVITVESLKSDYPEIAAALIDEGKAIGMKEGAKAEMARIEAVRAQVLPGHEALVEEMVKDGVTTGDQAAMRILQAERQLRNNVKTELDNKSGELPPVPPTVPPADKSTKKEDLTTEDGMKAYWDKNQSLRDEFDNDFEAFKSYQEAVNKGLVRVLKK